ncbi:MAG: CaiB/BaiF CoA-transferase family protein [Pseudomonadota bacterium]
MAGPLAGLKVIEMQGLGPCPLAGQFLADLGAEVTLITRKSGKADPTDITNRGKRSIALNLKAAEGVEAALRLVERADILIEGFRPGVMERMGLGPDTCAARNPRLVFGRMTGWGQDGPLSQTAGHDINYLGITGVLHAIGRKGEPPIPPLNIGADYAGGTMFLLLGVLSALFERQTSGKGQVVDAAMVDGAPALMSLIHTFIARGMWSGERESNLLDGGAPFYRNYETKDGKYISVGALEPQFFDELVALAALPEHHKVQRGDPQNWPDQHAAYEVIFRQKTRDEWAAIFAPSDACVGPVLDWSEAPSHPHLAARGTFISSGGIDQAAPAPRFDRTPPAIPTPPPQPGGDTVMVLAELGYSEADIAVLKDDKVIT